MRKPGGAIVENTAVMKALRSARENNGIAQELQATDINSFDDLFVRAVKLYGDRPAFTCFGHTLTFSELDQLSSQMADALLRRDYLQKGDRVAIQLPNLLQYPVFAMAVLKAGMTIVNVNPLYTDREIEAQLNDSGAKMILTFANLAGELNQIVERTQVQEVVITEFADLHPAPKRQLVHFILRYVRREVPRLTWKKSIGFRQLLASGDASRLQTHRADAEDIAVLQYTGGTTGRAKGVMLTHANLISNMHQVSQVYGFANWEPGKMRMMMPLPLYHIYAFDVSLCHGLNQGHESILIPNPRDLPGFIKEMKKMPFDGFAGLNTLFNGLMNRPEFCEMDFSRLRLTLSGGMALTRAISERWKTTTGVDICEGYGLTESSGILCVNIPGKPVIGTVGIAFSGTEVRISDDEGKALGLNEPGELVFRGPNAMQGYWNQPEETAKIIDSEGWVHTGDIAIMNEAGMLSIVDRKKDMIIISGFNVYPNEIEDVVIAHPDVVECAVVGGKTENGEIVRLFVVSSRADLTAKELKDYCRERLTAYKVPHEVNFMQELPKSNVGKILRKELRDL